MEFSFNQINFAYLKMVEEGHSNSIENSILIQALDHFRKEKMLSWHGLTLVKQNKRSVVKDYNDIFGYIYFLTYKDYNVYYVLINNFQSEEALDEAYKNASTAEEMSKILFMKRDLSTPRFSTRDKDEAISFLAQEAISNGFEVVDS